MMYVLKKRSLPTSEREEITKILQAGDEGIYQSKEDGIDGI
jgi:hypothetical protein